MNTFSRSKKEWLNDQLALMDPSEHAQVLLIVKRFTNLFTETRAGLLVSTDALNDECLTEIERFVVFSADQRKRMDTDNKVRKTYERIAQK
jgi:hypothetical protein